MRGILIATTLALAVAACALVPREFRVELPARELVAPLAVVVVDRVGIVTEVADQPAGRFGGFDGVFQVVGEPDRLRVQWLGGMCDHLTTLTIEERGGVLVIREATERADACRAAGISREVAIGINRPVDPAAIVFEPAIPGG